MVDFGKIFIFIGFLLVIIGFVFILGNKIPFIGKLPGDLAVVRKIIVSTFPLQPASSSV